MKRISIIGGGASGTLLTVNLIKHAQNQQLQINLIEKNNCFGGVAYGMAKDFHLLNVPAGKMGAFPDDVEHFYKWLSLNNYKYSPADFVPRRIYGEYLKHIFTETIDVKPQNIEVNVIYNEAIDISVANEQTEVRLKSGETLFSDKVVLAFGNFLPPHVHTKDQAYTKSAKYFQNPWSEQIPGEIASHEDVLTIGTGLTAVDVISTLYHDRHAGKIFALSTHGLLPAVHAKAEPHPSFQSEIAAETKVLSMLKVVRQNIVLAEKQNNNWRAVIDSMRSFTPEIWLRLSLAEKKRFMRFLQRRWGISRHRMPPECAEILQKLETNNQLQISRGRIRNIEIINDKFEISFGKENKITVDAIINCTGSQCNYAKIDAPLVKNLIEKGVIKPDALNLGLEATPAGNLINAGGAASNALYTFGTALRGILWETTAMPEIRAQAKALAIELLENPKSKI